MVANTWVVAAVVMTHRAAIIVAQATSAATSAVTATVNVKVIAVNVNAPRAVMDTSVVMDITILGRLPSPAGEPETNAEQTVTIEILVEERNRPAGAIHGLVGIREIHWSRF